MLEKEKRVKRVSKSGVGTERENGVKNATNGGGGGGGGEGIQIAMIRILAMRSNVERVDNLRQYKH